jgi:Protein of unknown function (DUF2865)
MATGGKNRVFRLTGTAFVAAALTFCPLPPAHAEGLIQSFFNSLGNVLRGSPRLPEQVPAYAEPLVKFDRAINPPQERAEAGPAKAFCVRTCDGHYFTVRAHPGMTAAAACHAFCPASQTRLYAGSNIDYAVARDGSRYTSLDNAYAYRQHLVTGCTCNGRDQFGLAHIDAANDPTLKPGDVVVTEAGMMAFAGLKNGVAEFTPAASYPNFSQSYRDQLAAMRIAPATPGAPPEAQVSFAPEQLRGGYFRSAQR